MLNELEPPYGPVCTTFVAKGPILFVESTLPWIIGLPICTTFVTTGPVLFVETTLPWTNAWRSGTCVCIMQLVFSCPPVRERAGTCGSMEEELESVVPEINSAAFVWDIV